MRQSFLSISKLSEKPYAIIIGYPKATKKQVELRIAQMKKLGINSISFQGDLKLGSINVLGKGYVGIVVLAKKQKKKVAVKIRRTDSQRKEMQSEAKLLKIANSVGVGPCLIDSSKNLMIMEYLDGKKIGMWIKELKGKGSVSKLKSIIRKTLEDCYNLDRIGLDHGELSSIAKHVIIGKSKTTIIDFESASTKRRASNVTSATQGVFIGSGISKSVRKIYKIESKELNMRKISTQSDEQVIEVLTDVKGIGRWTAEMFLIFSLGRLDILPVGDLGLKKGIQSMYSLKELPEKEQIEQLAESWKPYRTVATWYLWKSLEKFDTIG